ncbi:aldose 1-epimerase [Kitasatospora cinereorecta]|uniref:Aldose 1-epimerase n=1 Tax=Kitasatospora cinereorecta TaxID=285560 RepID=A0ABW0V1N7_9ACTN
MTSSLWLHNDRLSVEIRPDKGADITSIVERRTVVDILWRTPWGRRDLAGAPVTGDSRADWLARYGGGWQQLVPNAGAERTVDGVRRGYHGEAAVVAWTPAVVDQTLTVLTTDLITAPLRLTRTLRLDGPTLHVRDTIHNTGDEPVPVMWVQHPGFGHPFVDEHATLTTAARTVLTDAEQPGNILAPDTRAPFPHAPTVHGDTLDLGPCPGPDSGRSVFACLTDFDSGWYAIDSPSVGFGIRVEWDPTVLPHAWLWQECHASSGFPWHRRAYVVAVEPANVLPGDPSPGCPGRGEAPLLPGGATWTSDVSLTVTDLP